MLLALPIAFADEPVGALRMRPNEMILPTVATEVTAIGRLDSAHPFLLGVEVRTAGIPGFLPGVRWASAGGGMALDPTAPEDLRSFDAGIAAWRRINQSQPVVAAQDLRLFSGGLWRDWDLGVGLGVTARTAEWSGGLYLPANHPGDIDARMIFGARALGARWEQRDDGRPDFLGAEVGGISAEFVYGRKLSEAATLTGHVGGRADWAVGTAGGEFATVTDTRVWLGGVVEVGAHHAVRVVAETKTAKDDAGYMAFVPSLTTAWRFTW